MKTKRTSTLALSLILVMIGLWQGCSRSGNSVQGVPPSNGNAFVTNPYSTGGTGYYPNAFTGPTAPSTPATPGNNLGTYQIQDDKCMYHTLKRVASQGMDTTIKIFGKVLNSSKRVYEYTWEDDASMVTRVTCYMDKGMCEQSGPRLLYMSTQFSLDRFYTTNFKCTTVETHEEVGPTSLEDLYDMNSLLFVIPKDENGAMIACEDFEQETIESQMALLKIDALATSDVFVTTDAQGKKTNTLKVTMVECASEETSHLRYYQSYSPRSLMSDKDIYGTVVRLKFNKSVTEITTAMESLNMSVNYEMVRKDNN